MKYSSADRANNAYRLAFGKDLEDPMTTDECPFFAETSVYTFLKLSPKLHEFNSLKDFYIWFDSEYPLDEKLNQDIWN